MNRYLFLLIIIFRSFECLGQETKISILENQKREILNQIKLLSDSVEKIELEINAIRSREVQKMITDSTLRATVYKGAKLKESPDLVGKLITILSEDKVVTVLDYTNDYFGVCTDSICGYMHEMWIKKNHKLIEYKKTKKIEEAELLRLETEQELQKQKNQSAKLEKERDAKYSKKYGHDTYQKLKRGYYWIGMNKEMATISLGKPDNINKTVGVWGIHEQWVFSYNDLYLYFENGILTSYQK